MHCTPIWSIFKNRTFYTYYIFFQFNMTWQQMQNCNALEFNVNLSRFCINFIWWQYYLLFSIYDKWWWYFMIHNSIARKYLLGLIVQYKKRDFKMLKLFVLLSSNSFCLNQLNDRSIRSKNSNFLSFHCIFQNLRWLAYVILCGQFKKYILLLKVSKFAFKTFSIQRL